MSPVSKFASLKSRPKSRVRARSNVVTSDNDNLSKALEDLVPDEYKGTDRYLDVVQWNLEWFGSSKSQEKDKDRYGIVLNVLESLNADLFIFQEVAPPSKDGRYKGSLDTIAEELTRRRAGDYVVYYNKIGGEQSVAMMWDREWLRAKEDTRDLFEKGAYTISDGKDAFAGRVPLYGFFQGKIAVANGADSMPDSLSDKFDFQILGVHLKAMEDGYAQRFKSAQVLSDWMIHKAPKVDADVMIMGDWNAPPDDRCWKPFHDLENKSPSKIAFRKINDPSQFSYLWLKNKTTSFVSRIDLHCMSLSSMQCVQGKAAQVVLWKSIKEVLAEAANITDREVVEVMKQIKEHISDHMPTVSRFYFEKPENKKK